MSDMGAWLAYANRENPGYNPLATEQIVTNSFLVKGELGFSSPGKAHEEWVIRSALVPAEQAELVASSPEMHSLRFQPSWYDGKFDFGETENLGDVTALVWAKLYKDPVGRKFDLRIRQDFQDYHCLRKEGDRYVHPIDGVPVLETAIQQIGHWEESPHVVVHADYLRDFLATRGWALFLQVIADRFAVAASEEELGISPMESAKIAKNTWQTVVIHPPGGLGGRHFVGRSSLYWNLVVPPYSETKIERSPWRWSFHESASTEEAPLFIVDEQGNKAPINNASCPAYLSFRREVLRKYQDEPGYFVDFHMRTWGVAAPIASEETIDVGINSAGLVNAFAADLAKLRTAELHHWASFSCPPAGEICREMFETRMQNNPPCSECVVEAVKTAIQHLDECFHKRFGSPLHDLAILGYPDRSRLNVGPLGHRTSEIASLAKPLYEWVVDRFSIRALRSALRGRGVQYDDEWKQIRLLEAVVSAQADIDAHSLLGPLYAINELRVAIAHSLSGRVDEALAQLGCANVEVRQAWDTVVSRVVGALMGVADSLPNS